MKFHLRVYDNSHFSDESEAYDHGHYNTYEEALIQAKAIVIEFLEHHWKKGMDPEFLKTQYTLFGEDPIILPNEPGELESFSAWSYAKNVTKDICNKLENN